MTTTVQLFVTCLIDSLFPEIGEAVVRVLHRAGCQVEFPIEQTCCGQPLFNAGLRSSARKVAKHTIQVFEKTSGPVVIPSGSCTAMVKHGYLELFAGDPKWLTRAQALADRTHEFSAYLVDILGINDLGARYAGKLAYQPSCHLMRQLGIDRQPGTLLANIKNAELIELPHREECCGFGGVFSVEHAAISGAMLSRKMDHITSSGAETIVACDAGCIAQISGGLHRLGRTERVFHLAQVLDNVE